MADYSIFLPVIFLIFKHGVCNEEIVDGSCVDVFLYLFVLVVGDDDSGDTGDSGNTGDTGDTGDAGSTSYAVEVAGEQCEGYPENISELMVNDPCLFNVCFWADVVGSYKPTDNYDHAKECFNTVSSSLP